MSDSQSTSVRQVLVAIDASSQGSAALEAAIRLALDMHAELHGLFIEDIELLQLAALPFAREVDSPSGTTRPLDTRAMEKALQRKAERVRQAIASSAKKTRLRWSFRTSRGKYLQTMLAESVEADLLLVGRQETPHTSPAAAIKGPILVIEDRVSDGSRALATAQRLADQHGDAVVVLIPGNDADESNLGKSIPAECYVQRCSLQVQSLQRAIQHWRPQLVLISRSNQLLSQPTFASLLTQLRCPLIVVGTP